MYVNMHIAYVLCIVCSICILYTYSAFILYDLYVLYVLFVFHMMDTPHHIPFDVTANVDPNPYRIDCTSRHLQSTRCFEKFTGNA